jgi:hypothetical protein
VRSTPRAANDAKASNEPVDDDMRLRRGYFSAVFW